MMPMESGLLSTSKDEYHVPVGTPASSNRRHVFHWAMRQPNIARAPHSDEITQSVTALLEPRRAAKFAFRVLLHGGQAVDSLPDRTHSPEFR